MGKLTWGCGHFFGPLSYRKMYSKEQVKKALLLLDQIQSEKHVLEILGYPKSYCTLRAWRKERHKYIYPEEEPQGVVHYKGRIAKVSPDKIKSCLLDGMSVELAAATLGYSPATVYHWRKVFFKEGLPVNMTRKKSSKKEKASVSDKEIEALKKQMFEMQLEMDVLRETLNVLKKDQGVNLTALKNREKAVVVDALRDKYSLPTLLEILAFPKSSYYYCQKEPVISEKETALACRIESLFHENRERYGYRRIHLLLKKEGITVSEKIVRRIMKSKELIVKSKKKRKYSSYQGEISPAVPNCLERNFHADKPNQKWLTDITEFSIPSGKLYLSPIIDCFDGLPVCWKIGQSPNAELVNSMLDEAITLLPAGEKPIVHSDRGAHYRWDGWIERMNKAKLTRSMSKKGCSPDNSACEGFFGILKNEMFYERDWSDTSLEAFQHELELYLNWFRTERIKMSLGGMSPLDYRRSKGVAT